jgi:hypothetical protein
MELVSENSRQGTVHLVHCQFGIRYSGLIGTCNMTICNWKVGKFSFYIQRIVFSEIIN